MKRYRHPALLAAAMVLATACTGSHEPPAASVQSTPPPEVPTGATLLEGLGDHHFAITSDHPEVQRWFDQGLMLTYANRPSSKRYPRATRRTRRRTAARSTRRMPTPPARWCSAGPTTSTPRPSTPRR